MRRNPVFLRRFLQRARICVGSQKICISRGDAGTQSSECVLIPFFSASPGLCVHTLGCGRRRPTKRDSAENAAAILPGGQAIPATPYSLRRRAAVTDILLSHIPLEGAVSHGSPHGPSSVRQASVFSKPSVAEGAVVSYQFSVFSSEFISSPFPLWPSAYSAVDRQLSVVPWKST